MHKKTDTAYLLALHLLSENRLGGRSWRVIAKEDFRNKVNHATLCRIAKAGGAWIPKDRKLQKVLGLIEPKPRTPTQKAISRMVKETKVAALEWFVSP